MCVTRSKRKNSQLDRHTLLEGTEPTLIGVLVVLQDLAGIVAGVGTSCFVFRAIERSARKTENLRNWEIFWVTFEHMEISP